MIFSNRVYSFRFHGGKSKLISYILFCGKGKTNWPSVYVSRWLLHAVVSLGKCCSKLEIRTKLMLKLLYHAARMPGVSHFPKPHRLLSPPPFISIVLLFFQNYLWVIKEARVRTMACSWLYKSATHQRKTFIPPNHSFARDPAGRRKFAITAEPQRPGSLTVVSCAHLGGGHVCLCRPAVAQAHLIWGEAISISKPLLILVESTNVHTSEN